MFHSAGGDAGRPLELPPTLDGVLQPARVDPDWLLSPRGPPDPAAASGGGGGGGGSPRRRSAQHPGYVEAGSVGDWLAQYGKPTYYKNRPLPASGA